MKIMQKEKGSLLGLLPMIVFLILFVGSGVLNKDFNSMPVNVGFVIAGIVAVIMNFKLPIETKIENYCKGASDPNILLMCFIFILAGAFANVAKDMGAVESTVNLGLTYIPGNVLVAGIFLIACFISIAIGTSMGTIVTLVPIAVGLSTQIGVATAIPVAAIVGGAMFGDNLSMVSDTTIAAARTQGCSMSAKFRDNFLLILPALILSVIFFIIIATHHTSGSSITSTDYDYHLIKILPYIAVLILAISGLNVLLVLVVCTIFAGVIGLCYGDFTLVSLLQSVGKGIMSMEDLVILALLIGGLVALIKQNKGLDYLIYVVGNRIKGKRGGSLGILFLVTIVNICTGNNTISILMVGPLAKTISDDFHLEPKRSASILDIIACAVQGIIPFGGQLLVAASLASISTIEIMKYNMYCYLMFISVLFIIIIAPNFGIFKYNKKNANALLTK